jgi:hypothetical protein
MVPCVCCTFWNLNYVHVYYFNGRLCVDCPIFLWKHFILPSYPLHYFYLVVAIGNVEMKSCALKMGQPILNVFGYRALLHVTTLWSFQNACNNLIRLFKWVRDAIKTYQLTSTSPIDEDLLHILVPPSFTYLAYKKMKVYGNHFWVDDE